jgi:hypothetical protein
LSPSEQRLRPWVSLGQNVHLDVDLLLDHVHDLLDDLDLFKDHNLLNDRDFDHDLDRDLDRPD